MALEAADVSVKRPQVFHRMPELDLGERHPGGVAVLAGLLEFRVVGGSVASLASGLGILLAVAGVALELGVPAVQGEPRRGMVLDLLGDGFLAGLRRLELRGLGFAAAQDERPGQENRDEEDGENRFGFGGNSGHDHLKGPRPGNSIWPRGTCSRTVRC